MSVTRTYYCNVCREMAVPNNELMGLYWDSTKKNSDNSFGGWKVTPCNNSENHICKKCINQLVELFKTPTKRIKQHR